MDVDDGLWAEHSSGRLDYGSARPPGLEGEAADGRPERALLDIRPGTDKDPVARKGVGHRGGYRGIVGVVPSATFRLVVVIHNQRGRHRRPKRQGDGRPHDRQPYPPVRRIAVTHGIGCLCLARDFRTSPGNSGTCMSSVE